MREVETVPVDLLAALASLPDPRAARGVRHRLAVVLGIAVCAVLAGARSFPAIAEWAQELTPALRLRLGLGRAVPSESTIRRVLHRLDPEALDAVVCWWLAARAEPQQGRRVIAVDGTSGRGAGADDGPAVHLLAAFDAGSGVVLGQRVVDGKTHEIHPFAPLLDRIDITGAIITADALHTQRGHVSYLRGRGAHYLLTVKANQPTLVGQLSGLPWTEVPVADGTTGKPTGGSSPAPSR